MKENSVFCEKCGSYAIAENYGKELRKMLIGEVKLLICSDCGHANFIQCDGIDTFIHFKFIPLYRGDK